MSAILIERGTFRAREREPFYSLCPYFRDGLCWTPYMASRTHCYDPVHYEECAFFTGRWDGL